MVWIIINCKTASKEIPSRFRDSIILVPLLVWKPFTLFDRTLVNYIYFFPLYHSNLREHQDKNHIRTQTGKGRNSRFRANTQRPEPTRHNLPIPSAPTLLFFHGGYLQTKPTDAATRNGQTTGYWDQERSNWFQNPAQKHVGERSPFQCDDVWWKWSRNGAYDSV